MRTRIWHSDWKPRWLIRCVSAALLSFMDKQDIFCTLILACVAVLGVACAGPREKDKASGPTDLGSSIEQEGAVYTPVSQSAQGCLLYNVHIPGGQAPAALVYRSEKGGFGYARPDKCVSGSK